MREPARGSFERDWPELMVRVQNSLRRRGVPEWLRDDIVQETGLRLFRMWSDVDPERSPYGLALRIANNLLWDHVRLRQNREVLGDVPEHAAPNDVEHTGLARMELARVQKALPRLSDAHRSVLLAEIDNAVEAPVSSPAAVKMMRMRARRRLTQLLEQVSGFVGFLGFQTRRRALKVRAVMERSSMLAEGSAAAAVSGVVATVTVVTGATAIALATPRAEPFAKQAYATSAPREQAPVTTDVRLAASDASNATDARTDDGSSKAAAHRYGLQVSPSDQVKGEAVVEVREEESDPRIVVLPTCGVERESEHRTRISCKGGRVDRHVIDVETEIEARP